jgi:hypothetical protein
VLFGLLLGRGEETEVGGRLGHPSLEEHPHPVVATTWAIPGPQHGVRGGDQRARGTGRLGQRAATRACLLGLVRAEGIGLEGHRDLADLGMLAV